MNAFPMNPYDVDYKADFNFSGSYFDAVVADFKNNPKVVALLNGPKGKDDAEFEANVEFLWKFLPINPAFRLECNEEQAKNVLRYLLNKMGD